MLEREADKIASQVMTPTNATHPPITRLSNHEISCAPVDGGSTEHGSAKAASADTGFLAELKQQRQSGGGALPSRVRNSMESCFGVNFTGVKIHQNALANRLAESIDARAFTVGQDIFFERGAFQPERHAGRHLLGHELVHTVQQRGASPARGGAVHVQRAIKFGSGAAAATTNMVDDQGKTTSSAPLFQEFLAGLREFFGFEIEPSQRTLKDNQIDSLDPDDTFQAPVEPRARQIEQKIRTRYARPIEIQSAHGGREVVDAEQAVLIWKSVRARLRAHARGDLLVGVSNDVRLRSPMGVVDKTAVHVKPEWLSNTYIRKSSGWGLFWMLLHEILHLSGGDYEHRRTSNNPQAPFVTETREQVMFNERSVKPITQIGLIEFELNVIRIGFGLPVRTNYAEARPRDIAITPGDEPIEMYFTDAPGAGQREYVGSVISAPEFTTKQADNYAASVYLPKDYDRPAEQAAIKAREAEKATRKILETAASLAPGFAISTLRFEEEGGQPVEVKKPAIAITFTSAGQIGVTGGYRYKFSGKQRVGTVSNGRFTVEGGNAHIIFDWAERSDDGWSSEGSMGLSLPLPELETFLYDKANLASWRGERTRSADGAQSLVAMDVKHRPVKGAGQR